MTVILAILFLGFLWLCERLGKKSSLKHWITLMENPIFDSWIERKLFYALKRKGYVVCTQYRCGYYFIDLFLPEYGIAIECDGHAYHSSPAQKKRDKKRENYIRRQGGWSVLRFTGSDINSNVNACVKRIESKIRR